MTFTDAELDELVSLLRCEGTNEPIQAADAITYLRSEIYTKDYCADIRKMQLKKLRAQIDAAPVVTDAMVEAAWQVYAAYGYDADLNMDRLLRAALVAALEVKG